MKAERQAGGFQSGSKDNPGELIRQFLAEKGWSQGELAAMLGIQASALSMFLSDDRKLAPGVLLKLSALTGRSAEFWSDLIRKRWAWLATPEGKLAKAVSRANESLAKAGLSDHLVPGLMADHQILSAMQLGELKIDPFDSDQVQSSSIDLYLGGVERSDGTAASSNGATVTIRKGEMVWAQSREVIQLSKRLVGRVGIPTGLAQQGLIITYGLQIDPGYDGPLMATIWNPVSSDCTLVIGETTFLSIELTTLHLPAGRSIQEIRRSSSLPSMPSNKNGEREGLTGPAAN